MNKDIVSYLTYLEFGFEVHLNSLEQLKKNVGVVKFSTGNFPYGGMERFLMTLRAFEMNPIECFDGFDVFQFHWISEFEHEAINLPKKTKEYLRLLQTK